MKLPVKAAVSAAFLHLLTACGGGGGGSASTDGQTPAATSAVAAAPTTTTEDFAVTEAATTATATTNAEIVRVALVGYGPAITTTPALKLANGMPVTRIDDLPEGIANSAWIKQTTGRLPMRVLIGPGTYALQRPWTWTPAQSGRPDSQLNIEAETAGTVVISGAQRMVVTKDQHGGAAQLSVSVLPADLPTVPQLYVNGERATRARTPNAGSFYYVQKAVTSWGGQTSITTASVDKQAFVAATGSLTALSSLTTAEQQAAVLVATHNWTTSHHRIEEWKANNEVRVSPAAPWAFMSFGTTQRYFIENVPSALDAENEWYQHPVTHKISYNTKLSQRSGDIALDLPRQSQLLQLQGDATANRWVEQINFKGLKFRYAQAQLPEKQDGQAQAEMQAAIQMDGARAISLQDCEVSHVGGYAIWLRKNVQYTDIARCEVFDTGAGGIKIGLTNQSNDTNATGNNTVRSNMIHSTGHQFPGGVGVWIGQSGNNKVEDNLIGDTTYTGISVGWTWGYGPSLSRNNQINRNFLYNIMQGALSDGAAIYTLGVSPGTEIKGNVIKNVRGFNFYGSGAWGVYNDEGSSNMLIDSNIVVGTDAGGYMQNFGANITLSNNVFAQGEYAELQINRSEAFQQVAVKNNRFIPTMSAFTAYNNRAPLPQLTYAGNRVSRQLNASVQPSSDCAGNCPIDDSLNIVGGTLLEVPIVSESGARMVLPNQVAANWSTAKLTTVASGAAQWIQPTAGISFDASVMGAGSLPTNFTAQPQDRPDLLSVAVVNGQKCLAFNDQASLPYRWEPYGFITTPGYTSGTTTMTYTLKVDANSEFANEWRDSRVSNYKVGPYVKFSGARGVMVNDQVVAPLPVGQWITVTISTTEGADQKWSLTIRYPDDSVKTIANLAPRAGTWGGTKTIYFISDASVNSTACIGQWTVSNR
ncbi:MAG TPA: right-handed parallel beta-helix repeat-containing protein [Candidatus Aquabacterium excrementipullorum]|nr:right-handed parallel beta-helix repeat-containing protein [Candidatus Aquabacterium excrementipullorum]